MNNDLDTIRRIVDIHSPFSMFFDEIANTHKVVDKVASRVVWTDKDSFNDFIDALVANSWEMGYDVGSVAGSDY